MYLLGVVEPSRPVDDHVRLLIVKANGTSDRARSVELAKLEETIEHRAVLAHVEALKLSIIVLLKRDGNNHKIGWRSPKYLELLYRSY